MTYTHTNTHTHTHTERERERERQRERDREREKCDWLGTWLLEAHAQNFLRNDWNQMGRVNLTIALINN